MKIPFNKAAVTKKENFYISQVLTSGVMAGDGPMGRVCEQLISNITTCQHVLMTPSCTAALEMAAILCDIKPGDEVIVPSYTFVSTASAFVLRGAKIVFVDVVADNLNIDLDQVESAITDRTKVIVPVHYAGFCCDMERLMAIANEKGILVVEDAAQALSSKFNGKPLGSFGHFACLSFHETKNYTAGGEGGALLVNDDSYVERAHIIREKGTNRRAFFDGQVDKYTWRDLGSSFLMSELQAAYLRAQLETESEINHKRVQIWNHYNREIIESKIARKIAENRSVEHNAHLFFLEFATNALRSEFIKFMKEKGVYCPFHYIPLHSSPFGKEVGSFAGEDNVTSNMSMRIVRLPIFFNLSKPELEYIVNAVNSFLFMHEK